MDSIVLVVSEVKRLIQSEAPKGTRWRVEIGTHVVLPGEIVRVELRAIEGKAEAIAHNSASLINLDRMRPDARERYVTRWIETLIQNLRNELAKAGQVCGENSAEHNRGSDCNLPRGHEGPCSWARR